MALRTLPSLCRRDFGTRTERLHDCSLDKMDTHIDYYENAYGDNT